MAVVPGMGEPITLVAAADLSAAQFMPVKVDSNGNAAAMAAITDIPVGILQNAPVSGDPASILLIGSGGCSKIQLGATLAAGVRVSSSAAGKAVAAATTAYTLGILLEGGALDELGVIALIPNTPNA